MDITTYVEDIQQHLILAADAGGDEARALAERLVAPLEAAVRLALQDALASAAEEITCELAPGSVEVRLRGRNPEFVVTPPPPEASDQPPEPVEAVGSQRPPPSAEGEDGAMARINLRLPDHLKDRIEQAADREGLSINAWLVRAASAALAQPNQTAGPQPRSPRSSQRFSGWAR